MYFDKEEDPWEVENTYGLPEDYPLYLDEDATLPPLPDDHTKEEEYNPNDTKYIYRRSSGLLASSDPSQKSSHINNKRVRSRRNKQNFGAQYTPTPRVRSNKRRQAPAEKKEQDYVHGEVMKNARPSYELGQPANNKAAELGAALIDRETSAVVEFKRPAAAESSINTDKAAAGTNNETADYEPHILNRPRLVAASLRLFPS
jgi:hypothetical protein